MDGHFKIVPIDPTWRDTSEIRSLGRNNKFIQIQPRAKDITSSNMCKIMCRRLSQLASYKKKKKQTRMNCFVRKGKLKEQSELICTSFQSIELNRTSGHSPCGVWSLVRRGGYSLIFFLVALFSTEAVGSVLARCILLLYLVFSKQSIDKLLLLNSIAGRDLISNLFLRQISFRSTHTERE